jgi:hypothetical protein
MALQGQTKGYKMQNVNSQKVGSINVGQTVRLGTNEQNYKFVKVTKVMQQNPHYYRIEFEGVAVRYVVGVSKYFNVVSD